MLDLQLVAKGEPSLFVSETQKLAFRGRGTKRATYQPPALGTTGIKAHVTGTTAGGFRFTRVARCDVHS